MRKALALCALSAAAALIVSCASIRTTGPKTAYDRCVDNCDDHHRWCTHPTFPTGCDVEYDACLVICDDRQQSARR